jgi:hypothetical protein
VSKKVKVKSYVTKDGKRVKQSARKSIGKKLAVAGGVGLVAAYGLKKRKDFKNADALMQTQSKVRSLHKNAMSGATAAQLLARKQTNTFEQAAKEGLMPEKQAKYELVRELTKLKGQQESSISTAKQYKDLHKGMSKKIRSLKSPNPFVK